MASHSTRKPRRDADADQALQILRNVPSVDECLRVALSRSLWNDLGHRYVTLMMQRALSAVRAALRAGENQSVTRNEVIEEVIRRADTLITQDRPQLQPVVNATGVVLHTNLGRALLAEAAIEASELAARSPVNLEFDLETGGRGDRDDLVEEELCALTGAEAATVVNNNAAAVLLALNSIAEGREVIVSRGELIEIGGSFRIPDVMAKSAAQLREVGTTNRTHLNDYESAIGPQTGLLLKVHPSNYRVVGFTAEVSLAELVKLGDKAGVPVMEDLGSGALIDLTAYGLPHEPVVADRIAAGAGLLTFSGDKLLGGPQAGLIVGKKDLIQRLKANPLKRALRCGKVTLAAISATLRLYLRSSNPASAIPTLRLLARTVAELESIGTAARDLLSERLGAEFKVELVASTSQVGSGAQPTTELESRALRIGHATVTPDAIARKFRRAHPPVIGRIKDGFFQLDLRTIESADELAVSFRS
jgi:L-seryl-tRNA(Ser) seleniumtransferase